MNTRFNHRTLGDTGLSVTSLGYGGAAIGGLFGDVTVDDAKATVAQAQAAGISYFDTAPFYGYGRSERRLGDILRGQEYVLSTKVGRILEPGPENPPSSEWPIALPFHPVYDYSYDAIMRSFEHSLQRLGLDHIDILFVHDIGEMVHGKSENDRHIADLLSGGYRALDELRSSGQVKAIGMGVCEIEVCEFVLDHGNWDTFLLAGRYTLLEQGAQDTLIPKCLEADTSIIIGGPFNSGILAGGDTFDFEAPPQEIITRMRNLKSICRDHDVPIGAAALQFPIAHPVVASVIPGPRSVKEIDEIITWASWDIPLELWSDLKSANLIHKDAPTPVSNPYLEEIG